LGSRLYGPLLRIIGIRPALRRQTRHRLRRGVHFEIVYGASDNDRGWWDNPGGARIGFAPQDNAEVFAKGMEAQMAPEDEPEVERAFHGGPFTGMEFSGDPSKIE